jgi:hypothetical protein
LVKLILCSFIRNIGDKGGIYKMVDVIGNMYVILSMGNNGTLRPYEYKLYNTLKEAVEYLRARVYDTMRNYINNSYYVLEIGADYAAIVDTSADTTVMKLIAVQVNDLVEEDAE